jgi:hypothetical protein
VYAIAAGGDTSVVDPNTEEPISILENAREPEDSNIRVIVPSLLESDFPYAYMQVLTVTGGTLKDGGGGTISLGENNNFEFVSSARVDFRFTPSANRNTDASFTYRLIDIDETEASDASTVTIPITPVNVAPTLTTTNGWTGTGLTGTYYRTDYNLTGDSTTRLDPTIDFDSSVDGSCGQTVWDIDDVCPEDFSVRWTGQIKAPVDGDYNFATTSDDGVRLWIDGQPLIDNWTTHGPTLDQSPSPLHFAAGSTHDIELDYYERGGGEVINLMWSYDPGQEGFTTIPTDVLYPGTIRPELTYVTNSPAVIADDGLSIGDVDSDAMTGATAKITTNYHSEEDSLIFTDQNDISGTFDIDTGTLTLSGTSSIASYQTALRSIKYLNSSTEPNTDTRTLQFQVYDGEKDSNVTTRDIIFSSENSPPEILQGETAAVSMDEDGDTTAFSLSLDANDPNFDPVSWTVTDPATHGNASVEGSGNTAAVHYTPNLHYSGSDSFVVQVSDGQGGTDAVTVNVTIRPFSDNDSIATAIEDGAPHNGDGNGDGITDSKQSNIASFINPETNYYITVAVDDDCSLTTTAVQNMAAIGSSDHDYSYPLGLANFTADCGTAGYTTTVTQYYFSPPAGDFAARKVINETYQTIHDSTVSRQTIGGQPVLTVSYQVTDGGPLDDDGEADGVISDPAGPALLAAQTDQSSHTSQNQASSVSNAQGEPLATTGARTLTVIFICLSFTGVAGLCMIYRNKKSLR